MSTNGPHIKYDDLDDNKKLQVKELSRSYNMNLFKLSLKSLSLLILLSLVVTSIGTFYLQSKAFCFIGGIINGFVLMSYVKNAFHEEKVRVAAEVKKILNK